MDANKGDAEMASRYINPYTDFGFKKIFGEDASKDSLIDFLNSILPPHRKIANLSIGNSERLPALPEERKAAFDVYCHTKEGEKFIVEMQKAPQHFFRDRAVFYSTFAVQEQALRGDWDFDLNSVYFVAILDFIYDKNEDKQKFFRTVSLKDQDGEEFYDKLYHYFFQMPFFTKTESELETHSDKWFYFLKNLDSFDDIPTILREPIFEQAFEIAETCRLSPEEKRAYEAALKVYRDNNNVLKYATDTGRAEEIGRAHV
jgi:predicted transposase/invertase (TIGR01784 family)